jgi:predicted dehydrogenase
MQNSNIFKVGIIGAGRIVEQIHLPILKSMQGVRVEWITDKDLARRNLLTRMFRVPQVDADEVEASLDSVDILLLAIPVGVRRPFIELAARNNKALYVEKPFARSLDEHLLYESLFPPEMLCAGFNRRTYSSISLLKELIATSFFGSIRSVRLNDTNFDLKSGGGNSYLTQVKQAGGGLTIETGIHLLDQIVYVTQAANLEVESVRGLHAQGLDYEMRSYADLTNKSGLHFGAEIFLSRLRNEPSEFVFTFERACVHVPFKPALELLVATNDDTNRRRFQLRAARQQGLQVEAIDVAFYELWRQFLEAITTKSPNLSSACNSRLTSKWIGQIYQKLNA